MKKLATATAALTLMAVPDSSDIPEDRSDRPNPAPMPAYPTKLLRPPAGLIA